MDTHIVILLLSVFNSVLVVYAEKTILRTGRHVCSQEQIRQFPVQTTESYCRPKYQRVFVLCPGRIGRICVTHRLMYITEFKKVVRMIPHKQQIYRCCPGWTSYNWQNDGCTEPVCDEGCENGGVCVLPNRCQCTVGWEGMRCQEDIDECSSVEHGCTHVCQNIPGSYQCSCHHGFKLRPDQKSCEFCLSCTDEYQDLILGNQYLREEIEIITNKNIKLNDDIKALREDLLKVRSILGTPNVHTPVTPSLATHEMSMFQDLKNKVESLEEKIENCSCSIPIQSSLQKSDVLSIDEPTLLNTVTEQTESESNWDYGNYTGESGVGQ